MNRKYEYEAMIEELNRPVTGLDTTLDRAYQKKRKNTAHMILRPMAGMAACFVMFVVLVNFSAPVAYACSRIPFLQDLAAAVTFSRSLTDAVENDYVQPMEISQTKNGITAEIAYLIVDQKQVNVFYRLKSPTNDELLATPVVKSADGIKGVPASWHHTNIEETGSDLRCLSIDFVEDQVPDSLTVQLKVYTSQASTANYKQEDYINFEFLLTFDPRFTASGKVFPVNQTVILDGQSITITDVEVYPTHLRVDIAEDPNNTALLRSLDFYIETDWGMKFDPVSGGITATGTSDSPTMTSYRADSTYFYEADRLKIVITGAEWLRKDMETTYLNLVTGEHGSIPAGVNFEKAVRNGNDWIVTFRGDWEEGSPMYQLFRQQYYDSEGNFYEFNQWSTKQGEKDKAGNVTYFYEEFPLKDYPYEEVWLSPAYSHYWTAPNQIVIPVQG